MCYLRFVPLILYIECILFLPIKHYMKIFSKKICVSWEHIETLKIYPWHMYYLIHTLSLFQYNKMPPKKSYCIILQLSL